MQTRKRILLWSALEQDIGAMLFVLNSKPGRQAHAVHSAEAFTEQLESFRPDAAVLFYDGSGFFRAELLACGAAALGARTRILVVCRTKEADVLQELPATMSLVAPATTMADISHALDTVLARKRSPSRIEGPHQAEITNVARRAAEFNARLLA